MLRIHRKRIHPTMVLPLDKMARMQQRGRQPLRYLLTLLLIGVTGLSLLGYRPLFAAGRQLPSAQSTQGKLAVVGAQGADLWWCHLPR